MATTQVVRPVSGKIPTFEFELEVALPVLSLWDALKNGHTFIPKIAPHIIASVEDKVEGKMESGQPGLTRHIKYGSFASEGAYVKDKLVKIDEKTHTLVTSEVEGGHLAMGFTKFIQTAAVRPVGDSKSTLKVVIEFEVDKNKLKQADVEAQNEKTKQMLTALIRLTEEHLIKGSGGGAAAAPAGAYASACA